MKESTENKNLEEAAVNMARENCTAAAAQEQAAIAVFELENLQTELSAAVEMLTAISIASESEAATEEMIQKSLLGLSCYVSPLVYKELPKYLKALSDFFYPNEPGETACNLEKKPL